MKHASRAACAASALALCAGVPPATAADTHPASHPKPHSLRADDHAPLGVMGDHAHGAGEWMVSYRAMRMHMEGSRNGSSAVSLADIAATPNVFAAPPTLRVAPLRMTMDMHMFGLMYAPSDRLTVMAMANYLVNDMDHVTFQGMMGDTQLGAFTTKSEGFGDTRVSALYTVEKSQTSRTIVSAGVSLPTGSIDEVDAVLAPNGMRPTLTLPYPMQLGSGTVDPFVSVTHARTAGRWGGGAQASALLRVTDNDQDYRRGDEVTATAWASYAVAPSVSLSGRLAATSLGKIEGRDARIGAPVQTANPAFQGGERLEAALGANYVMQSGPARGHRLAAELVLPISQNLNGPQLETDWSFGLSWQLAFGGRK